jgi:hypothetical protein
MRHRPRKKITNDERKIFKFTCTSLVLDGGQALRQEVLCVVSIFLIYNNLGDKINKYPE